jgi:hypothetical protein
MLAAIDNWLFILFVAAAALLRLLSKAAGPKTTSSTPEESTFPKPDRDQPPVVAARSDEEQIRKFLEALGRPRSADVPPPVPPRTDVAPRPVAPVQPPRSFFPSTEFPKPKRSRGRPATTMAPQGPGSSSPPPERPQAVPYQAPPSPLSPPVFEVRETTTEFTDTRTEKLATLDTTENRRGDQPVTDLARLLRTPGGLRQAIILKEIFGTPRSLQSLEDLPGTA